MKSIEQRWGDLTPPINESVFIRFDDNHPYDFYLGRDASGELILLLIVNQEPPIFPNSQSILVNSARRQDGRWALRFILIRKDLQQLFYHLCKDLIESSRSFKPESKVSEFVLARFIRWQKLLQRGATGLLDDSKLQGLIGELLFLELIAIPQYGISQSVKAWVGPLGADQDFRFEDFWYEVKTIKPGATIIKISSIEQLDMKDYSGQLVVVYIEKASNNESGAFNPIELVNRIKRKVSNNPVTVLEFEEKLIDAGLLEFQEYQGKLFILRKIRKFSIEETFPRLRRKHLSPGIRSAVYDIDISTLITFEHILP